MSKPVSRGKFDMGHGLLLALLAIGLLLLSWYFFQLSFSFRHLQIDRFITAIIFTCLLGYFLVKGIASYKAVDIYRSHLKLKWLWGLLSTKIYPSDIARFGVAHSRICLRKGKADILLNTRLMNNDAELVQQLALWQVKRKDTMQFKEQDRLGNILMKIAACIACMIVFYTSCIKYREPVSYDSLVKVHGHLSKQPQNSDLTLEEYPSISFHAAMKTQGLSNYQPGTPAMLWIAKDAYQKHIVQRRFTWSRIEIFEAELNGNKILELNKYNKEADEIVASKKGWAFPLILVFVVIFFALKVPTR